MIRWVSKTFNWGVVQADCRGAQEEYEALKYLLGISGGGHYYAAMLEALLAKPELNKHDNMQTINTEVGKRAWWVRVVYVVLWMW